MLYFEIGTILHSGDQLVKVLGEPFLYNNRYLCKVEHIGGVYTGDVVDHYFVGWVDDFGDIHTVVTIFGSKSEYEFTIKREIKKLEWIN